MSQLDAVDVTAPLAWSEPGRTTVEIETGGWRHRINVNVVCPGLTETPLLQSIREQSEKTAKVIDAVTRGIPLGRVGRSEEIADAVLFLVSPAADFITGQTLSVSGGLTMC